MQSAIAYNGNQKQKLANKVKRGKRQEVIDHFSLDNYPNPIVLLMLPSLAWKDVIGILDARDPGWRVTNEAPNTSFVAFEIVDEVYTKALKRIPGGETVKKRFGIDRTPCVGNSIVKYYVNCSVEEGLSNLNFRITGGWLDLTGELSQVKLKEYGWAFDTKMTGSLFITGSCVRNCVESRRQIDRMKAKNPNFKFLDWARTKLPSVVKADPYRSTRSQGITMYQLLMLKRRSSYRLGFSVP